MANTMTLQEYTHNEGRIMCVWFIEQNMDRARQINQYQHDLLRTAGEDLSKHKRTGL